jgi:hypothetical protein
MKEKRKFLGIHYQCCNVYARAYLNHSRDAYSGSCPRCGRRTEVKVGPGGSSSRFFTAQ